uniref:RNA binding motif protein 14a n=1 Tax=Gadus morhua TaxID=8049 RepID=A0A8C4ZDG2_GADMO
MSDNVKLFVGNLPLDATHDELNKLFSPHGEVNTCSLLRQYAFITLKGEGAADRAIRHLDGKEYRGRPLVVEESRARPPNSTKVFVGNLSSTCTADDLHGLFQSFGRVLDCDKVKARLCSNAGYAFVHMERKEEALLAIDGLNGTMYKGRQLSVELSKAQPLINQLANLDAANLAASMAGGSFISGCTLIFNVNSPQVQQSVHNSFYNTTSFDPTYTALKGLTSARSADGVNPAIYGALASQVYGSVADQVYDDVANHDTSALEADNQSSTDPSALFEAARAKFFQQGQKVLAEQQAGRKSGTMTASDRDRSPIRGNRAPLLPDPVPGSLGQGRSKRRALLPTPPGGPELPTDTTTPAAAEGAADPIARYVTLAPSPGCIPLSRLDYSFWFDSLPTVDRLLIGSALTPPCVTPGVTQSTTSRCSSTSSISSTNSSTSTSSTPTPTLRRRPHPRPRPLRLAARPRRATPRARPRPALHPAPPTARPPPTAPR